MKEIALSQGYTAKVDDDDFEWLSAFRWKVGVRGGDVCAQIVCCPFLAGRRNIKEAIDAQAHLGPI